MNQADILVIGVIYNTWPETIRYLDSLAPAVADKVTVILADNSEKPGPADFMEKIKSCPFLYYFETGKNLGYFGGAREGLQRYLQEYQEFPKWVLVTNVDIIFAPGFFHILNGLKEHPNLGIVAPSIISRQWHTDYNPQLVARYSKNRLRFYHFIYLNFLLHNLFLLGAYFKKWALGRLKGKNGGPEGVAQKGLKIYAAHGSCLVFTDNYFIRGGTLDLPHFLFGEELMVAETAKQLGLDVVYHPELVIYDYEHASTGFFVTPKMNSYYRQSIRTILDRYYC